MTQAVRLSSPRDHLHEKRSEGARARTRETEREREKHAHRPVPVYMRAGVHCDAPSTLDTHQHVYQHVYLASIRKGHSSAAGACGPAVRRASDTALGESGISALLTFDVRRPGQLQRHPQRQVHPPPSLPSPLVTAAPPSTRPYRMH